MLNTRKYILTLFHRIFLFWMILAFGACASKRIPVPPGVVPEQISVYAEDEQYGHEVLNNLTEQFPLDRDDARINRVRDVVDKLTKAAKADKNPWNAYVLVGNDFKNAAATRGNYIFVWTGMLSHVNNDAELATILSHEIGHVLAGHTASDPAEETNRIIAGIAGAATSGIVGNYGLGGPVADIAEMIVRASIEAILINPDSQVKELEADQIGLFIMADAKYNPDDAIQFWTRIQNDPDFSGSPIEFLSSHPSTQDRLSKLIAILPDAQDRYYASTGKKKPNPTSKTPNSKQNKSGGNFWKVMEAKVDVYKDSDRYSDLISTLNKGQKVKVIALRDRWLEIQEPVNGFVQSRYLAPDE